MATTRQTLLIAASLMAVISVAAGGESVGQVRYKRGLMQLCELIRRYTGKGCLSYNGYGCYCGYGTSTGTPVDAVDRCCRAHDYCYDAVSNSCLFAPHVTAYSKQCNANSCTCTNAPRTSPCAYATCSCDLAAAQCLKTTTYNQSYYDWNRDSCVAP